MNYSTAKQIKQFCDSLTSMPDWREVLELINMGEDDFTVDNVRFIETDSIDSILEDELASDEYVLGCFNAWAIAHATDWPIALIEAAQKGEQFEEIGKAMTGEHVAALADILVRNDGYGHHFNSYNFGEEEFSIDSKLYHVFDNH
jgi:hypothetical protein